MKKTFLLFYLLFSFKSMNAEQYVYFLHNMWLEIAGVDSLHPEYGKCEYQAILDSFTKRGFVVRSEVRPNNTDGVAYANQIARKIDNMLVQGVKPSQITVIGTSKGGYIAQYVSSILMNEGLNFVFIGCCGDDPDDPDINVYGNILSIYERGDRWQSCKKFINKKENKVTRFKEIELHTGMKHGFLYKALPGWIAPASKWANAQYD